MTQTQCQNPMCWAHLRRDASVPAAYIWHAPVGNVIPLCAECCASWRANAAEIPELAPARITSMADGFTIPAGKISGHDAWFRDLRNVEG